jgi:uncharacterized heparinase superfamily protein
MSSSPLENALLWARTVRLLHPGQVWHRLRLRLLRQAIGRFPAASSCRLRLRTGPVHGWPGRYVSLDRALPPRCPSPVANSRGRFCFLGEERRLGDPADWQQSTASRLWRYHLHYFEWAWAFLSHPDREWAGTQFRRLWRSWRSAVVLGRGDAWSPYPVSVRAWALCGVYQELVKATDEERAFVEDLALHAGYLRANLELDVGGNHLVKNLKALVGLGLLLGDESLVGRASQLLERELPIQVLRDGGHFERSPSYHCQVLGDLIDVDNLLSAAGHPPVPGLQHAIQAMREWLGAILLPDGDVPLFNDCTLVGTRRIALLQPSPPPSDRLTVLEPSGYVAVRPEEGTQLVADVGIPCPSELPAHAHADCLSFELAVRGRRVVVDSGTSTYDPGPRRSYERSTAAHNTVEIDGESQTELWGVFRAARRAEPRLHASEDDGSTIRIAASHDGYRRLPGQPVHRRTWSIAPGAVRIVDEVTGNGSHRVVTRLHLAPGIEVTLAPKLIETGPLTVAVAGGEPSVEACQVASNFGCLEPAHRIAVSADGPLPQRIETSLAWMPACPSGTSASPADRITTGASREPA